MNRAVIAGTIALLALSPSIGGAQDAGIKLGAVAPRAAVTSLDGAAVDLSKYYGEKPVVLEFWATWCPLCKKLEPKLEAVRQKYAGRVNFVGVGVSANQTAEKQAAFVKAQHISGDFVFDRDDAAQKAFAAPHTSYVVVIGADRKVVYTGVGPDQDVETAVQHALQ